MMYKSLKLKILILFQGIIMKMLMSFKFYKLLYGLAFH